MVSTNINIGYHASHEQFAPSALLHYAKLAENAGFKAISCSDHFQPWSVEQGHSGFAWSWLGAAMQQTCCPFSVVTSPGQRYHPAIIAQACATLSEMFPNRFTVMVGSGEAFNENITGEPWPIKSERNKRLQECVNIMRALWAGETVTYKGLVHINDAKLYTLPIQPPMIIGAAMTPKTAEWMGSWTDGLITISQPYAQLQKIVDAFHRGGGKEKPLYLKVQLAYGKNLANLKKEAWQQWRTAVLPNNVLSELHTIQQLADAASYIREEDITTIINISTSIEEHLDRIRHYIALGFSTIFLHQVTKNQIEFIQAFSAIFR